MLLESGRASNVCVLCADAMGTHSQMRRHRTAPSMAQLVAHCLASDGAAALLLSREPGSQPVLAYRDLRLASQLWSNALDQNDLTADADNQPFILVGKDIRVRLVTELSALLTPEVLSTPLFVHPGGAALMRLLTKHFGMLAETAEVSSSILEEHGNLGSPSVLLVLERALAVGMSVVPRFRLVALGPGIVSTVLLFDGVERESRAPLRASDSR
jgi:alkylresorcinol/alkylpyrone synthase